jgi:hypothetical protein
VYFAHDAYKKVTGRNIYDDMDAAKTGRSIKMNTDKQIGNMETIFHILGNMKFTKSQRSQIAMLLATSFTNGFHAALIDHAGIATKSQLNELVTQSEICQQVMFLEHEYSK